MKLRLLSFVAAGLILTLAGCPGEDEIPEISNRAERYWNNLFHGYTRNAYDMLDSGSRGFIAYADYARKVGFGPSGLQEVKEYWMAYYPLTAVEVNSVSVKGRKATVTLTLTQPDPTWFPDEAHAQAEEQGLEGNDYALFLLRAQTEALLTGKIPIVKIQENLQLIKEDDVWWVVFDDEG